MIAKVLLSLFATLVIADAHIAPVPVYHAPQPYKFGYTIKDHHGQQHRQEAGDGHSGVSGSYGFTDERGVHREVNYVADHAGFRAQVKTNEPGTANQNPAAVQIISSAHPHHGAGYHLPAPVAPVHHGIPPPAPLHYAIPPPAPLHHVPAVAPYAAHHVPGLGLGYGIGLAHVHVTGYDSRYGHY